MMDIKYFTNGGARGLWIFFLHITILFHQCNHKNIIYQLFYCCLHYIFYTGHIVVCMCFSLLRKITLLLLLLLLLKEVGNARLGERD